MTSDLFDYSDNILPKDGEVSYQGNFIPCDEASELYETLLATTAWENDHAIVLGKVITMRRKLMWYGDKRYSYTYTNTTKVAQPWAEALQPLRKKVEHATGEKFNTCLLNLYHDGDDGMSWHSDSEDEMKRYGVIASISLGAQRRFMFKHKVTKETLSLELAHGSLLQMKGKTQEHWLHQVPKSKKVTEPRINLTFRQMK